jgi:AraC family transcriptional regulator, regulatory protein of adaptative response / DNA-3-methyladenine glycosylase II
VELNSKICDRARLARDPRFDGHFFIAVLSTGIYCRPICPSPTAKRENVRYFRTAEEALAAGFRACLRCRPESAPGTPAWKGTGATVGRALRLIAEGVLREESVAGLSRRLGVGTRHLNRLFWMHLGASPIAVAKTWRLNSARRLISETDLPMSRVAMESGFRTIRRFNDSVRTRYGRSPSALRRLKAVPWKTPQNEYVLHLSYRPPYDWESILAFLAARAIPGVEEVVSGAYRRSFAREGSHGIVEVRQDSKTQGLEVRVRYPEPTVLLWIANRVRAMFDLAGEPATIVEHFRRDPLLRRLVQRYPGLRIPGAWDSFELAVRAILGQQVTVAAASTMAGQIARMLGQPLSLLDTGGLSLVFPTPKALAETNLTGMPQTRARAIRALARAWLTARPDAAEIDEAFLQSLAQIKGVGEWTVQYISLRALGQPDAFPVNDLVLLRAAGDGHPLTVSVLRERAERWRPWRAYAAIYLWRSAAEAEELPAAAAGLARARTPVAVLGNAT